jgi:mevalonate kinase
MRDQYFYGHGKVLLTGEYFIMDGAQGLALPTTVGQSMKVKYRHSYRPTLNWKSIDHSGKTWFESDYEFWHFDPIKAQNNETQRFISHVLKNARKQNPHFLRDEMDVFVETKIEFPLEWGLGSSSTLLYNIAQWAYIGPFELLKNTIGGSGYDIACAQALGPIKFRISDKKPKWESVSFLPDFRSDLYFVYLGQKQSSMSEVQKYKEMKIEGKELIIKEITQLTTELTHAPDLVTFSKVLRAHEDLVGATLGREKVKEQHFSDYWGEVKSLGAWGGDFVLVTSDRDAGCTRKYFEDKGLTSVIPYDEIIRKGQDHSHV